MNKGKSQVSQPRSCQLRPAPRPSAAFRFGPAYWVCVRVCRRVCVRVQTHTCYPFPHKAARFPLSPVTIWFPHSDSGLFLPLALSSDQPDSQS